MQCFVQASQSGQMAGGSPLHFFLPLAPTMPRWVAVFSGHDGVGLRVGWLKLVQKQCMGRALLGHTCPLGLLSSVVMMEWGVGWVAKAAVQKQCKGRALLGHTCPLGFLQVVTLGMGLRVGWLKPQSKNNAQVEHRWAT